MKSSRFITFFTLALVCSIGLKASSPSKKIKGILSPAKSGKAAKKERKSKLKGTGFKIGTLDTFLKNINIQTVHTALSKDPSTPNPTKNQVWSAIKADMKERLSKEFNKNPDKNKRVKKDTIDQFISVITKPHFEDQWLTWERSRNIDAYLKELNIQAAYNAAPHPKDDTNVWTIIHDLKRTELTTTYGQSIHEANHLITTITQPLFRAEWARFSYLITYDMQVAYNDASEPKGSADVWHTLKDEKKRELTTTYHLGDSEAEHSLDTITKPLFDSDWPSFECARTCDIMTAYRAAQAHTASPTNHDVWNEIETLKRAELAAAPYNITDTDTIDRLLIITDTVFQDGWNTFVPPVTPPSTPQELKKSAGSKKKYIVIFFLSALAGGLYRYIKTRQAKSTEAA